MESTRPTTKLGLCASCWCSGDLAGLILPPWLLWECYDAAQSLPDETLHLYGGRIWGLLVANLLLAAVVLICGSVVGWVRFASSHALLHGWHREWPRSEFKASDERTCRSLDDYLQREERVFEELRGLATDAWHRDLHFAYSRFAPASVSHPENYTERNWNRSQWLPREDARGGVLLLHGLSDSPYSLRTLAHRLHDEGYSVLALRLPGHGTCPAALGQVVWQDWTAAVRVAVRGLRDALPPDAGLSLVGYSNGGALSLHYALTTLEDPALPRIDKILLFAPMVGLSPLARFGRMVYLLARATRDQRLLWSSTDAEIDPFKYCSWPLNGNVQAWGMTRALEKRLARMEEAGRLPELPPILAMQSVADSTVVVSGLVHSLFGRLSGSQHELFLVDINRDERLSNLFTPELERDILDPLEAHPPPHRLSILKNHKGRTRALELHRWRDGNWFLEDPQLAWPEKVMSLSHVSLGIPPDDPLYGTAEATREHGLPLGTLNLRAEPGVLLIAGALFLRTRYNPFYGYMEDYALRWMQSELPSA